MTKRTRPDTCYHCGQVRDENGYCKRCNEQCERCGEPLLSHYPIEGLHLCPNSIFSGTGQLTRS